MISLFFGKSFEKCLDNLDFVLERCIESNLVLNWEKYQFLLTKWIILGKNNLLKLELIEKLPPPKNVKGIRSFLGHVEFYRRFIKDFSKISKPLSNLLVEYNEFNFDENYLKSF